MHPTILVFDDSSETRSIIGKLETLGITAQALCLGDSTLEAALKAATGIMEDKPVVVLTMNSALHESVLLAEASNQRSEARERRSVRLFIGQQSSVAHTLLEIAALNHPITERRPEMPEVALASIKIPVLEEFYFERPKPDWPKPQHHKPKAAWKHRHNGFHHARSRDKARMR